MKEKEFESSIEELQKQIQNNQDNISLNDKKIRIAEQNRIETKALLTFLYSSFSYMLYIFLLALFATLITSTTIPITNPIPIEYIHYLMVSFTIGIGTIGRKKIETELNSYERFKSFSKAKSQREIIEEEAKYAIESEKLKNRNKVLSNTISSLKYENDISNISLFNTSNIPKKQIEDSSTLLKEKYSELDSLSTKKSLHENFLHIRSDIYKAIQIMFGLIMCMALAVMIDIPLLVSTINGYSTPVIVPFLIPTTLLTTVFSIYTVKNNKYYKEVFNHFNHELGKNALPDSIKDEEIEDEELEIDIKIGKMIWEITELEAQLQQQKIILESFMDNDYEKSLQQAKEHTSDEPIIDTYRDEDIIDITDEIIFDEDDKLEEKGPTLVLRRKPF